MASSSKPGRRLPAVNDGADEPYPCEELSSSIRQDDGELYRSQDSGVTILPTGPSGE